MIKTYYYQITPDGCTTYGWDALRAHTLRGALREAYRLLACIGRVAVVEGPLDDEGTPFMAATVHSRHWYDTQWTHHNPEA